MYPANFRRAASCELRVEGLREAGIALYGPDLLTIPAKRDRRCTEKECSDPTRRAPVAARRRRWRCCFLRPLMRNSLTRGRLKEQASDQIGNAVGQDVRAELRAKPARVGIGSAERAMSPSSEPASSSNRSCPPKRSANA